MRDIENGGERQSERDRETHKKEHREMSDNKKLCRAVSLVPFKYLSNGMVETAE